MYLDLVLKGRESVLRTFVLVPLVIVFLFGWAQIGHTAILQRNSKKKQESHVKCRLIHSRSACPPRDQYAPQAQSRLAQQLIVHCIVKWYLPMRPAPSRNKTASQAHCCIGRTQSTPRTFANVRDF